MGAIRITSHEQLFSFYLGQMREILFENQGGIFPAITKLNRAREIWKDIVIAEQILRKTGAVTLSGA